MVMYFFMNMTLNNLKAQLSNNWASFSVFVAAEHNQICSQKPILKRTENKNCLQKWGGAVFSYGPRVPNLILTRVQFSTLQTNTATLGGCSMLMVWLVLGLSLGVAIYLAPLSLWSYALLTQALLVTNSNIKTAITTKIYHLQWPARS